MDGEFEREVDDDGRGPGTGKWKQLGIQVANVMTVVGRMDPIQKEKEGIEEKLRE